MTGIHFRVVWKCGECLVQCLVHLFRCALEEAAAAANEQCVAGEYGLVIAVFEVEADAVLRVAWCVEGGDLNGADVEC